MSSGTPAFWRELVVAASKIDQKKAAVYYAGPADCVEPEPEDLPQPVPADVEFTDNDCGAILDGGKDDISPVQLWHAVMEKYKVATRCDEELERLYAVRDKDLIDKKREEKLLAIAAAVEALAKLHHTDTLSKLKQFAAQDRTTGMTSVIIEHGKEFLSN